MGKSQAMKVDSPCPSPSALFPPASRQLNLADPAPALPDNGSVSIHIQWEGEVEGDMEVEPSQVEEVAPWLALPVPRLVLELELMVLSSCLVRLGREMEEEISSLQANLCDIEGRIKGMYEERQGYCLHAMMVHEGDSKEGHYWACMHYR